MASNFDQYGRVRNIYHPVPVQSISNFSQPAHPDANFLERLNNAVANIGRWIDGSGYGIASYIGIGFIILVWIAFIVSAVNIWIESGFWSFLFFSILGGVATYYISLFAGGLIMWVIMIVVRIFRVVFYNLVTLAITLALLIFIGLYSYSSNFNGMVPTERQNRRQGSNISNCYDLSVYGLVGHVKSFYEKSDGELVEFATFTSEGKFETLYGKDIEDVKKIKRDSDGNIISMIDLEKNNMDGGHDAVTYKWSEGKLISSTLDSPEGQTTTSYIYDEKGKLIGTQTTGFQGDNVNTTENYTYTEFDKHGNWTKRTRKYEDGSFRQEYKDERTIIYWN